MADRADAERMVHWAAQKTRADVVIAFYPDFHVDAIKNGLDRRRLAMKLREYAEQLER